MPRKKKKTSRKGWLWNSTTKRVTKATRPLDKIGRKKKRRKGGKR